MFVYLQHTHEESNINNLIVGYRMQMNINNLNRYSFERKRMRIAFIPAVVVTAMLWLAFLIEHTGALGDNIYRFAMLPREISGLKGILFMPLLHSSFSHLLSNTLPLLILVWFLFYFYSNIAFAAFAVLWVLSGSITWVIGRESYHAGASGLIFGLLFFLFFSGIFRKYIPLVSVSLIVAFIYGGMVWSIFPITEILDAAISWEGHLSGAISGLILSIVLCGEGPQKPEVIWEEDDEEPPGEDGLSNYPGETQ